MLALSISISNRSVQRDVIHRLGDVALGHDAALGIRIVLLFVQVFSDAGVVGIVVHPLVIITHEVTKTLWASLVTASTPI